MTTQYRTFQEVKSENDYGQIVSDQIYSATLTAATATVLAVPGGGVMGGMSSYDGSNTKNMVRAVITTDLDVWVSVGGVSDIPNGAAFAADTSELVPGGSKKAYDVNVGVDLSFYSKTGTTPSISVAFYALPS